MPQSTGLDISQSAMNQAYQGFLQSSDNAKNIMTKMESDLEALLSPEYQGAQAGAFRNVYDMIKSDVDKATQALNNLGDLINSANNKYSAGDSQAAQGISKVAANVPTSPVLSRLS